MYSHVKHSTLCCIMKLHVISMKILHLHLNTVMYIINVYCTAHLCFHCAIVLGCWGHYNSIKQITSMKTHYFWKFQSCNMFYTLRGVQPCMSLPIILCFHIITSTSNTDVTIVWNEGIGVRDYKIQVFMWFQ